MQPTSTISATGPAAFGVIAERFRRAGQPEKAVTLCREGLEQFPDHLSARVTLGWSLLDLGEYQEAFDQLKSVNKRAPDNLAAIRGLAELHERGIGLVFDEAMPDAETEFDPEVAPLGDFDPVMPAHEAATATAIAPEPAPELPMVSEPLEDLDPIYAAPHFELEDVIEAGEAEPMFDLAGLLDGAPEPAQQPFEAPQPLLLAPQPAIVRKPVSVFDREPLALRDDSGEERAGELHEWLSRVRERRFNSVSQLMAG